MTTENWSKVCGVEMREGETDEELGVRALKMMRESVTSPLFPNQVFDKYKDEFAMFLVRRPRTQRTMDYANTWWTVKVAKHLPAYIPMPEIKVFIEGDDIQVNFTEKGLI